MDIELQFLAMVDTGLEINDLIVGLQSKLPGATRSHFAYLHFADNTIDIGKNDDDDPSMVDDPDDGFLYYPYEIAVFPIGDRASLDHQLYLAREITKALESMGCRVAICAAFEHLL